jgi:hypothetical protein
MCLTNRKVGRHWRRMVGALASGAFVFAVLARIACLDAPSVWAVHDTRPDNWRRIYDFNCDANPQDEMADYMAKEMGWQRMHDFDGDGKNDEIEVEFTGGAHCCYYLTVRLSLTRKAHRLPVSLDGGYVGGLDPLSQPDHFSIRKIDGELSELLMEANTYNGEPYPLPKAWKRRFGLKTNFVAVSFPRGRLRVRDWPSLPRPH